MTPTCPHGDPTCPCPDGDLCHYEGSDAWPCPRAERAFARICADDPELGKAFGA